MSLRMAAPQACIEYAAMCDAGPFTPEVGVDYVAPNCAIVAVPCWEAFGGVRGVCLR